MRQRELEMTPLRRWKDRTGACCCPPQVYNGLPAAEELRGAATEAPHQPLPRMFNVLLGAPCQLLKGVCAAHAQS